MSVTEEGCHRPDAVTPQDLALLRAHLDTRVDHHHRLLDARCVALDRALDRGVDRLSEEIAGLGRELTAVGARLDEADRRAAAPATRVDLRVGPVVAALAVLGALGLLLIGVAQILG